MNCTCGNVTKQGHNGRSCDEILQLRARINKLKPARESLLDRLAEWIHTKRQAPQTAGNRPSRS